MLFNSYQFLFLFFPAALIADRIFQGGAVRRALVLAVASLAFYASWNWRFVALLLGSIAVNYAVGRLLQQAMRAGLEARASRLLAVGVTLDLLLLGVFKYAQFMVDNLNAVAATDFTIGRIVLPLGISFFTFEQIGFLVDLRRGHDYRLDPLRYGVFVAFFPRLVAGPILRYGEIVPQLARDRDRDSWSDLAIGLSMFSVGLAKKAFLADGISPFVAPAFQAAATGRPLDLFAAWGGALAYTLQLYFDFSGYSDMAIGAARCFGIRFPQNFDSPYKSRSIVEFWRRWHITLSRFLRDYLYIPLGGNRCGSVRRYVNLMMTMILGGLWHGAAWTFLAWGALHGSYLMVNHGWNGLAGKLAPVGRLRASRPGAAFGWVVTFVAVIFAWVFFRATSFQAAFAMIAAMAGAHGAEIPAAILDHLHQARPVLAALGIRAGESGAEFMNRSLWIAALLALALFAPNTQQIFAQAHPTLEHPPHPWRIRWRGGAASAMAMGVVAVLGLLSITRTSAFLYWQF